MLYILNKSPEGTNNDFIPLSGLANSSVLLSFLFGRKLLKTHKAAEPLHMNNILHYYEQFFFFQENIKTDTDVASLAEGSLASTSLTSSDSSGRVTDWRVQNANV